MRSCEVYLRTAVATLVVASMGLSGPAMRAGDDELSVDALLQKVLEARGGEERWAQVRTLKIEGTWTAFSEDVPMTILRMRPDLYRFEHVVLGGPAVLAYDGEHAWVQGAAFGAPQGQGIAEAWKRNVIEEAPFTSKLLGHAAGGAKIELIGRERVDGRDAYVLKVEPKDRPEETWYVDCETFLETKRVSTTFDVFSGPGAQLEMETYYMEYRDVGGVMIPYREERHFGTRYNVVDASSIEINPEVDAAMFRMPPSAGETDGDGSAAGS
jgi:hypothetical protein